MGRVSFADGVDQIPTLDDEERLPYSVYDYDETPENKSWAGTLPVKQGLYDPELEKDACGVGFAAYAMFQPRNLLEHTLTCLSATSRARRATKS